jgi:hypothetical protein
MQEHKAASQGPRVDLDELLSRLDNDKELLSELVTIFKEDFPSSPWRNRIFLSG